MLFNLGYFCIQMLCRILSNGLNTESTSWRHKWIFSVVIYRQAMGKIFRTSHILFLNNLFFFSTVFSIDQHFVGMLLAPAFTFFLCFLCIVLVPFWLGTVP